MLATVLALALLGSFSHETFRYRPPECARSKR